MAKLELALLVGAESKEFLRDLTNVVERLEKLGTLAKSSSKTKDNSFEAEHTNGAVINDDDEDFVKPKKKSSAKKNDFEDEDEDLAEGAATADDETDQPAEDEEASFDSNLEEDEEEVPPKKKKAQKKITLEDINDACKARAGRTGGKAGREEVLGILKKKFKTSSISDLRPEQYPAVLAAMGV